MAQPPRGIDPVLAAIPTYNERENLGPIVKRLHTALPKVHVLVVDDGSPDGTDTLADELADADLVVGSRYVPGGSVVNWPKRRELLSRGGNLYSRVALGVKVNDITAGFRAYRREVLEKLDLDAIASHG